MKRLHFSIAILLLLFSVSAMAQTQRAIPIQTPGYFYVEPDNVRQDSQNASISLTINNATLSATYKEGLQVVFKTKELNGNNDNVQIQIIRRGASLGVKNLLARDGQTFEIGELDAGIMITATYDGTSFISDFNRPRQFRYVEPVHLALTGNAYVATDSSIPPIISAPILLGIKAEATNTGNVTLSVNGSIAYSVFLSNGEQIPAGALQEGEFIFCFFTTTPNVGFRAINLRPARDLKGIHVATLPIPSGNYNFGQYVSGWQIASGVQGFTAVNSGIDAFNDAAVTDAILAVPHGRFSGAQLGWYAEVTNGSNVVATLSFDFGDTGGFAPGFSFSDSVDLRWFLRYDEPALQMNTNNPNFSLTFGNAFETDPIVIPATADYELRLYVAEN